MSKKLFLLLTLIVLVLSLAAGCTPEVIPAPTQTIVSENPSANPPQPSSTAQQPKPTIRSSTPDRLVLATTTSTQDSGLLDYLLPDFEKQFNTKVDVIAVGTGQALQLGKDGNADVLLVHARAQEDAYMAAGDGTRREDVMYNDFVIVGPASDPAGIKGIPTAVDAFKKIAAAQAAFISRGDNSGTNTKELAIWKSTGITPAGKWYISAGQGMGEVLTMADEMGAYTLSDRATYLARTKNGLKLQILVEKDKSLLNPYGVIAVNPNKGPQINAALATEFIDWLISVPVQQKISEFGKADFGISLFIPTSRLWMTQQGSTPAGNTPTP
jgi:tungstate transport system substrate-binding protein